MSEGLFTWTSGFGQALGECKRRRSIKQTQAVRCCTAPDQHAGHELVV